MMNGFGHGWWMFGGWFWMMLIWLVPIILLVLGIQYFLNGSKKDKADKTPREIIQERYARGELNREQYEQMLRDIEKHDV